MEQVTIGVGALLTVMVTLVLWAVSGIKSDVKGLYKTMMPRTECAVHHAGHQAEHKAREEANEKDKDRLENQINGVGSRVNNFERQILSSKN